MILVRCYLLVLITFFTVTGCSDVTPRNSQLVETTRQVISKYVDGGRYYIVVTSKSGGNEKLIVSKEDWNKIQQDGYYTFIPATNGEVHLKE